MPRAQDPKLWVVRVGENQEREAVVCLLQASGCCGLLGGMLWSGAAALRALLGSGGGEQQPQRAWAAAGAAAARPAMLTIPLRPPPRRRQAEVLRPGQARHAAAHQVGLLPGPPQGGGAVDVLGRGVASCGAAGADVACRAPQAARAPAAPPVLLRVHASSDPRHPPSHLPAP